MFMTEEKLPYKVETKHNLWRVFLERGTYSDYENETLIFSGNSAEEIWQRLKEYTKCFDESCEIKSDLGYGGLYYLENLTVAGMILPIKCKQLEKLSYNKQF